MGSNNFLQKALLGIVLLLSASASKAQFFNPGIKAGITTNQAFTQGLDSKAGLTAGLIGEFKFIKWLRLRTEANLLVLGDEQHFWENTNSTYYAVSAPVLLQFMPVKNLHIGAGAEVDYLIHGSKDAAMPTDRFNLGIVGHLEYRFFNRLGIGLRYINNLGSFGQFSQISEAPSNSVNPIMGKHVVQATLSFSFGKSARILK